MKAKITQKQALIEGLNRYYTGKPCTHGHYSERYARTCICCECNSLQYEHNRQRLIQRYGKEGGEERLRDYNRARGRRYREKNKEALRKYNREYMRKYRQTTDGNTAVRRATKNYNERQKECKST